MLERQECIFKEYLSNCHRGAVVLSISVKRLCSIREASNLRTDSLCSNLPNLNQDNFVANKNCLSTYTLKTHIDRRLKRELSSQSCSSGKGNQRYQNSSGYSIACSVRKTVTSI